MFSWYPCVLWRLDTVKVCILRIQTILMKFLNLQHMKNYEKLLKKISSWLKPEGLLFIHIFVHKSMPYHFEVCTQDVASTDIFWLSHYPYFTTSTYWRIRGYMSVLVNLETNRIKLLPWMGGLWIRVQDVCAWAVCMYLALRQSMFGP